MTLAAGRTCVRVHRGTIPEVGLSATFSSLGKPVGGHDTYGLFDGMVRITRRRFLSLHTFWSSKITPHTICDSPRNVYAPTSHTLSGLYAPGTRSTMDVRAQEEDLTRINNRPPASII